MGTYTKDSEELLKLVGGKENIAAVKVVKGSFTQAGHF